MELSTCIGLCFTENKLSVEIFVKILLSMFVIECEYVCMCVCVKIELAARTTL